MDEHILQEDINRLTSEKYSNYTSIQGVTDTDQTPETEKDLGVTYKHLLKCCHPTVVKATNQMKGLIRQTFKRTDCTIFRLVYIALVRPHLDYAPFGTHTMQ